MPGDLNHNVGRGAKPVQTKRAWRTGLAERTVTDQTCTEKRGCLHRGVMLRNGEAERSTSDTVLCKTSIFLITSVSTSNQSNLPLHCSITQILLSFSAIFAF